MFRGQMLTFTRDLTGFSIYFSVYESLTRAICKYRQRDLIAADHLLAGGECSRIFNSFLLIFCFRVALGCLQTRRPVVSVLLQSNFYGLVT